MLISPQRVLAIYNSFHHCKKKEKFIFFANSSNETIYYNSMQIQNLQMRLMMRVKSGIPKEITTTIYNKYTRTQSICICIWVFYLYFHLYNHNSYSNDLSYFLEILEMEIFWIYISVQYMIMMMMTNKMMMSMTKQGWIQFDYIPAQFSDDDIDDA